ncbi:hypothetical protein BH10BAC3_BH10BAC3_09810 [soil metagenome]
MLIVSTYTYTCLFLRRMLVLLPAIIVIAVANGQPAFLEGNWNNGIWSTNNAFSNRGAVFSARVQATGTATRDFLFNNSSGNYNPQWTGSTADYNRATDVKLPGATFYFTGGAWNANMNFQATDGFYYTFISGKNSTANNDLAVLSTPFSPRNIVAVVPAPVVVSPGQAVTVTVTLDGNYQGAGATLENAWLRYTTDNWASSFFVAVGSLNVSFQGTATIPASANTAGTTVQYYALTTGNNTTPTHADADYQGLNMRNAAGQNTAGTNFSYTVATGWTTANAGSWSTAATWTANAVPPTSSSLGIVTLAHNVSLDQNATAATLNLTAGTFIATGSNTLSITATATISGGAVFTNSSANAANISINNFVVSNGGTYNHDAVGSSANGASTDFPGTTRSFGATSNVVITKWASGGTAPVALPTIASPGWGNLTINISSLGGTYWEQNGSLTKVQGDFIVKNTANKELTLFNSQSGGTTFAKNVYIEGGILCVLQNGNGNGINININGNLSISGNGKLTLTTSSGTFSFFSTSEPRVYLKGDLSVTGSAQILQPNTAGVVAIFVFKKTSGIQYFTCDNITGVSEGYIGWGVGDETGGGVCTNTLSLNSNFIAKDFCVFRVYKNATLNCPGEIYLKGAGASSFLISPSGFTLYTGSTIKIGSKDGIIAAGSYTGNIQTSGARNFNTAAHYVYTGAYNQVTGNGLPTSITGSLSIANTGAMNDNIVTLTTNNTETKTLNLNSGYFAAGTGQTCKISNNGTVNGTAGGDCVYLTANGGNIHLLGNNSVTGISSGRPRFYDVTIGSGISTSPVTFSQNATIYHYCTINAEGAVDPAAPTYAMGSALVYNSANTAASPYNRSIEWGQATAGAPGYPWHVIVQNGTNLNLGNTAPPLLECGGNLTVGILGGGSGTVNMSSLSQPLIVKGNLTIGDTLTGSPIGTLNLSSVYGGDLWLHGNFSRGKNSFYTDNSRAIYFKGTADATVNTPAVAITPAVPSQYFSYAEIDKTAGTETVTLNCPLGINNEIGFTKGVVTTSATNLLTVTSSNAASVIGGSNLSFVNGPMARSVNSTSDYTFPVGKTGAANTWRPVSVIPASTTVSTFLAEYFKGPTPNNATLLSSITSLENNEYWEINRTAGSTGAVVKLNYKNPGSGTANWMPVDPCAACSVGVAQYSKAGTGYWDFTKTPSGFDPVIPETRLNTSDGPLYSAQVSSFSLAKPFTAAAYYDIILPVQLLGFTGKLQEKDGRLEWRVASSNELAGFELQHSNAGRSFSKLSDIAAANQNDYSFLHKALVAGTHFYRLLVKEKNGHSFYSQVVLLTVGSIKTRIIGLANNPVTTSVTPQILSAGDQKVEAFIMDAVGKLLYRRQGRLNAGQNQWPIAVALPSKGLYFITINTADGESATLKFIKE